MPEDDHQPGPDATLNRIRKDFDQEIGRFTDLESRASIALDAEPQLRELENLQVKYLGKKSELATERKKIGIINDLKSRREFASAIDIRPR